MENPYTTLQKKMTRFNEWEVRKRNELTSENRMEQFLALYELCQWQEDLKKKSQSDHLKSIVETAKKLKKAWDGPLQYH